MQGKKEEEKKKKGKKAALHFKKGGEGVRRGEKIENKGLQEHTLLKQKIKGRCRSIHLGALCADTGGNGIS